MFFICVRFLVSSVSALAVGIAFFSLPPYALAGRMHFDSELPSNIFSEVAGRMTLFIEKGQRITSGAITLEDESGKVLKLIPVANGRERVDIDLGLGFHLIKARASFVDGSNESISTTAAVIGSGIAESVRRGSRFGFFGVDPTLGQAVTAGGRWNRTFLHINGYAPADSGFRWVHPWHELELPTDQTWIKQLTYIPGWLRETATESGKDMYPPNDWNRFRELINWAISKDTSRAKYIEVLNEPEQHWKGSESDLIRYFRTASSAIRQVDRGIHVLGPSMATIDLKTFKRLVQQGLLDTLDGVSMHAYVNGMAPEGDFIQRVIELRRYLSSIGKEKLPLYITEFGWTTEKGTWQKPVNELTQARYVSRALILLSTQQIRAILLFCLRYKTPNRGEAGFSVLNENGTPKPAYVAYANTVRWLSNLQEAGNWKKLSADLNLVQFRKERTNTLVLWTTTGQSRLSVPCGVTRVEDMMGRKVSLLPSCQIDVGESPVFVEVAHSTQATEIYKVN